MALEIPNITIIKSLSDKLESTITEAKRELREKDTIYQFAVIN